jgi:hypothetical protein
VMAVKRFGSLGRLAAVSSASCLTCCSSSGFSTVFEYGSRVLGAVLVRKTALCVEETVNACTLRSADNNESKAVVMAATRSMLNLVRSFMVVRKGRRRYDDVWPLFGSWLAVASDAACRVEGNKKRVCDGSLD